VSEGTSEGEGVRAVLRQLVREMGIPFLIATGWTVYSLVAAPLKRNVVDATTVFGGSFFLASWAFAQWFRVKKQQAVESGLGGIVKKQEALVAALTVATERLEGHSLLQTCAVNGVDRYQYLRALLVGLPKAQSADDYEALLPWNIDLKFD
jgi:hypothetical protein